MADQHREADRHEGQRGHSRGRRRPLGAGQPSSDQPVEQDIAGPARGRQQAQADAQIVGGRARTGQHGHARPGHQCARQVRAAARGGQRDGKRAEELQRHRQAEAEPADRAVQGQVHGAVGRREQQHRPPLRPGERAPPRAAGGQQHDPGDPLAHGDHAGRADHPERQRPGGRAELIGQGGAGHQRRAAPRPARTGRIGDWLVSERGLHTARMRRLCSCVKCMIFIIYTLWL
jgi:hypothetical protein